MKKKAKSVLEALAYLVLGGGALAFGVAGLLRGQVEAPTRTTVVPDIARASHPLWYWLAEAFWIFVGGAFVAAFFVALRNLLRPRPKPRPRAAAPAVKAPAAQPPKPTAPPWELKSTSPGGRYVIRVYPWEARMSLWIECPELYDTVGGRRLFVPKDGHWSLDSAQWQSESVVTMRLRKYPGDHSPSQFEVTLDCASLAASLDSVAVGSVAGLEPALERAYQAGQKAFAASRRS
ncbi:MAG: hypothetical protein P4L83_01565 [Nevskia sp.]|nr:hypothetical protein [Nevskia sp.]